MVSVKCNGRVKVGKRRGNAYLFGVQSARSLCDKVTRPDMGRGFLSFQKCRDILSHADQFLPPTQFPLLSIGLVDNETCVLYFPE